MSRQAKEWAKRRRAELMELLGGKCHWCGESDPTKLTFDCIEPTGHDHHAGSTDQRMCFYLRQHRERDNIQILCFGCNGLKGSAILDFRPVPEMNWQQVGELAPF